MTEGSPTRDLITFSLPLILGYILQQMYQVIDAAIVGRWIGVGALAAVGASTSVMFIVMGFCNGSCAGFAIPVAQSFGAKDYCKMRHYVANALRIAVVMAAVITLTSCMMCDRILGWLNTPTAIWHDAWIFLFLQFLAIPFTIGYNLLSGFIRALGNSRQPFLFLIISALVNIVLDVLFILGLGLGVAGAGLATLLAQVFAVALCWHYIHRKMSVLLPQTPEERRYDNKRVSILLNNGVPMGLQFSITGIGIMMLQSANNALGTVYVASFTAAMRIKYLFTCVFDNVGVAMATYCGQNIGAKQLLRVKKGVRSALLLTLIFAVASFVVVQMLAEPMMSLFVKQDEQAVISHAALFMRVSAYFYPFLGLLCVLRYSIQGLGHSNLSMLSGVMEMMARCAVSVWLVPAFHFLGVCFADPMAWCMADCFLVPAFLWLYRRMKRQWDSNQPPFNT